jgi:hypothetical protein
MAKWKMTKDNHRSTKHTYKTKDRVTRTPIQIGGKPRCSEKPYLQEYLTILIKYGPIKLFSPSTFLIIKVSVLNLPFRSTWVHPRFLVGLVLLDL